MAHLYINSKGYRVTRHSYTGGEDFRFCPEKYRLKRVSGWNEREQRASFAFGICIEEAVRHHHSHGSGADEFSRLWEKHKSENLTYTATEVGWNELALSGREMLQLYAVRLTDKTIPILSAPLLEPRFQVEYRKEVFPSSDLAGIEFTAYVDMIAELYTGFGPGPGRTVYSKKAVIDIKTSGQALDTTPGMLSLEPQLRSYAWITGIPDVAFLWFHKVTRGIKEGSIVTLLAPAKEHQGKEFVVVEQNENDHLLLFPRGHYQQYKQAVKGIRKKSVIEQLRHSFMIESSLIVKASDCTKQKLQFISAHITKEQQDEIAEQIGRDIISIHAANKNSFWPKLGSVRGLSPKCPKCEMRGICLGNNQLRDEMLVRKDDVFGEIEE